VVACRQRVIEAPCGVVIRRRNPAKSATAVVGGVVIESRNQGRCDSLTPGIGVGEEVIEKPSSARGKGVVLESQVGKTDHYALNFCHKTPNRVALLHQPCPDSVHHVSGKSFLIEHAVSDEKVAPTARGQTAPPVARTQGCC
jgi:hypothetical protein